MSAEIEVRVDPRDKCRICAGELRVVRATDRGWFCKCQRCGIEQILKDEEIQRREPK